MIFDVINKMSSLRRWSQAHCNRPESVLEHTAVVAMYSLHLASKHEANIGVVLQKAIIHDVDEIVTGDIPTPTKYANGDILHEIKKLERVAALEICNGSFFNGVFHQWENAKDLSTESGCIIAIADHAAVVYKIKQEVEIGNRSFLEFRDNIHQALQRIKPKVWEQFIEDIDILIGILGDIK